MAEHVAGALQQFSRLDRNNQKWDAFKEDIRQIYMREDETLQVTMNVIEHEHGFTACERKWKCKLKEWGFDKYIPSKDMQILVAKAHKRKRDERKDTVFIRGNNKISAERLDNFKRRKTTHVVEAVSPSAETPCKITYHTPRSCVSEQTTVTRTIDSENHLMRQESSGSPTQSSMYVRSSNLANATPQIEAPRPHSISGVHSTSPESGTGATIVPEITSRDQDEHSVDLAREDTSSVVAIDTAEEAEETEGHAASQSPRPARENGSPPADHGPSELSNTDFLILSIIYAQINAECKKSSSSQGDSGTISISSLYSAPVMDAIFKDITKIPAMFPNGSRDYMLYCKIMDKMARKFEERGFTTGAMIALSLLQRGFGKRNSPVTTQCNCTCTYKLACIFDKKGEDALAESHYRSAFEGFQALEDEDRLLSQKRQNYQIRCELSFARFLQRIGSRDEALNVLVNTLTKSLSRSCEAPATSAQLEKVFSSLEDLSKDIDADGHLMRNLAGLRKLVFTRPLFKVAYFDLAKLASTFSCLGRFDDADVIFDFAFSKIPNLENWNHKKVRMAICYAQHYQRQKKWAQSLSPVHLAFESLTLLVKDIRKGMRIRQRNPPPAPPEELGKILIALLATACTGLTDDQDPSTCKQLTDTIAARENYLFQRSHEHERRKLELLERERRELERAAEEWRERLTRLEKVGLLRETIGEWVLAKDDDVSTMGTKTSIGYGVTYSAQSVTGFSEGLSMGLHVAGIV